MEGGMSSQRFCLRWNNHQTNLLSVFDQLLHDEAFVDVTLAVEGQFLRAHKMVLSACSPLFQALFVGHPDKHPIVILKDVPYSDMRSLLDFMYRGEVSVDQDRLTAFLKVAESLRIKGLTEVNEERCDLPSIANSLLNQPPFSPQPPPPPPPPPSLHRLPMTVGPPNGCHPLKATPRPPTSSNPSAVLNTALTVPKRKRGRPRKLSGSSPNPPLLPDLDHDDIKHQQIPSNQIENHLGAQYPGLAVSQVSSHPPDMPISSFRSCLAPTPIPPPSEPPHSSTPPSHHPAPPPSSQPPPTSHHAPPPAASAEPDHHVSPKMEEDDDDDAEDVAKMEECDDDGTMDEEDPPDVQFLPIKSEEPKPGTSGQDGLNSAGSGAGNEGERFSSSGLNEMELRMMRLTGGELIQYSDKGDPESDDNDSLLVVDAENNNDEPGGGGEKGGEDGAEGGGGGRTPVVRRRMRRRTASSTDPAEALTEMSVRGLNLFRYASINEGIYKCMECAKADVLKTFKNKYSFQRHAFLYHEGHQRKVFPCPVCAKEFSRPDKMKNHMKMVHDCFIPKECLFPAVGFYLPP